MKTEIVTEAPTVAEAIDAALEELGVQQDVVEYDVLEEPGKRMFGSDRPAKVRVTLKSEFVEELRRRDETADGDDEEIPDAGPDQDEDEDEDGGSSAVGAGGEAPDMEDADVERKDSASVDEEDGGDDGPDDDRYVDSEEELDRMADVGTEVIEELLGRMALSVEIEEYEGEDRELILDVIGSDLGILIGRHGKTLDALQALVSAITHRKVGHRHPLVVDVEGYRARRREKLEDMATRAAERACSQGGEVRMRPMNSYERRVVHVALRGDERVRTESEGSDPERRVVISPR